MSIEEITEIVDYLDDNWNPVDEENARYKITYELSKGEIVDKKIEVLLSEDSQN